MNIIKLKHMAHIDNEFNMVVEIIIFKPPVCRIDQYINDGMDGMKW